MVEVKAVGVRLEKAITFEISRQLLLVCLLIVATKSCNCNCNFSFGHLPLNSHIVAISISSLPLESPSLQIPVASSKLLAIRKGKVRTHCALALFTMTFYGCCKSCK